MSKTIKHIDGNIGGYLVGRRHSEGGIKAINKSTNQPLEMEGGEVVITRNAVSDETEREFEGEMLTNKEILSRINESGGGVSFEQGGEIHAYGNKFNYGGHLMSDHEILEQMAIGGQIEEMDDVDFDFEETEMALGGALTSGLELTDLEGGALIQSGNNYPPMKIINYNSFPIYVFIDYREKKQKTLQKPLKLTTEADGLIRIYEYQHDTAYSYGWVLIENVLNISKLYERLDSKYVNSSAIVVCNNEFYRTKSSLQMRILDLLNEFSRFDDKLTSTRKGINKAIEKMDTYQNSYIKQGVDDFQNIKIKRVYFTQDIDWTKNSGIPKTDLDGYGMTDFFLIMHNRKQILTTLSRVKPSPTGKNHWNFLVIEFEDGRIFFDILSLKQNQSPINFDDIINTSTPRDEETVTILTNSQYINNSLAPDFVIQDSELADKQIKELPTTVSISLSTNNQTFQVGDWVKYVGTDTPNVKNGDIGEIVNMPTINNPDDYGVRVKGTNWSINSKDLEPKSPHKFQIGDEVSYEGNSHITGVGRIGKVVMYFDNPADKFTNYYTIKFDNDQKIVADENELKIASQSNQQSTQFKVGDKVKYIGSTVFSMKTGDVGKIIKIVSNDSYDVEFDNGRNYYLDTNELELYTNATNQSTIVNPNSIQQFHVGDIVYQFSQRPMLQFEVRFCFLVDGEWIYTLKNVSSNTMWNQIRQDNLVLVDESSRYNNEFKVGDVVRVVYPSEEHFGNVGIVRKKTNESIINIENDKLYYVEYNSFGLYADDTIPSGAWEGKDLILIESSSTQTSNQPTQTLTTPKFKVGDKVRQLDQIPLAVYEIISDELLDNKWVYNLREESWGAGNYQVRETNLVLTDESTRYNNEFNVGDIVQVVFDSDDAFANIGTITSVETMAINGNRVENPSKKLYRVDYNIVYGEKANKTLQGGNWEGKDLQLISSSTTTQTSNQPTQTSTTPMTPSTNAGSRAKLTIEEQELQKQINDLTDLLNLVPEYDFEDKIAISQELTTLQDQMNVYVAKSTIQNDFLNSGKIQYEQDIIDLMLSADCVKLNPRPTNTNVYQNGFSPNGKPTSLNKFNYDLIHTEQFRRWFGNYGLSYNYLQLGESNLGLSSKVVDENGEPLVVYMGVGREFEKITFNRFPIGYFAVNEAYAEWFATTKADDGVGYVLPFFLNIRRPLDFSMFGIDEVSPKDFFDWLYLETGMTGKELGFDDRYFLPNCPSLEVWRYIRFTPNFLNKLKEYKICDGIHFYENNPANPVGSNSYMTEVWTIFYSNQCKLASENRSEMILSANNSFLMKKGGLVK
jgi:hypothetical protein